MKIECLHADTCLSDYWRGHHLPHICIPVHKNMSLAEIKEALHSELNEGAIAGNIPKKLACETNEYELSEKGYRKFKKAIDRIEGCDGKTEGFFSDLEDSDEDEDCGIYVYAYFVFREI